MMAVQGEGFHTFLTNI